MTEYKAKRCNRHDKVSDRKTAKMKFVIKSYDNNLRFARVKYLTKCWGGGTLNADFRKGDLPTKKQFSCRCDGKAARAFHRPQREKSGNFTARSGKTGRFRHPFGIMKDNFLEVTK